MLATNSRLNHPLIWSFPSVMKSAGNNFLKSLSSCGYPSDAHESTPASIQTSIISGILFIGLLHFLQGIVTSSIHGLCKSSGICDALFFCKSFRDSTTIYSLHELHLHTGKGDPQNLCLVIPLSLKFSSQESNWFAPAQSGTQYIFSLLSFLIFGIKSSTLKNHC